LRDNSALFPPWRRWLYRTMALGWKGTAAQQKRLERCISIMAVAIIPVAVSIHTVTAWIFGMTVRPGWHSSIIGPDFVVGALYSGIAALIIAMALFRKFFNLGRLITPEHFRKLSLLLLTVCLVYMYFTLNEYIGSEYVPNQVENKLLLSVFAGSYAAQFWSMLAIGLLLPAILLVLPWTRTIGGIVTASVFANIGMWLMRYVIVVPTLASTYMPVRQGVKLSYIPTWVEWSITAGGFAAFGLMYILFSKVFPIISIWETSPSKNGQSPSRTSAEGGASK
jgi:Ni/Fe-hydrogenase subunit HybB-like protein